MRSSSRLVPALLGLALASSSSVAVGQQTYAPAPIGLEHGQAPVAHAPRAAASKHTHKGLLGTRSCTECQRERAKARDGVDVPPPPSAMPAGVHGHGHSHAQVAPGSTGCISCEADAAAMGGTIVPGSIKVTDSQAMPPGRAVVGGEALAAEFPTGRAVVGGAGPAPVGVARASQGNFTPAVGALAAQPANRDPSVVPSSMIPPAQTAIGGDTGTPRPRIITHLLDLPDLSGIGRSLRGRDDRASRSAHAAISYEGAGGPVTDLPASMVFGKGGR